MSPNDVQVGFVLLKRRCAVLLFLLVWWMALLMSVSSSSSRPACCRDAAAAFLVGSRHRHRRDWFDHRRDYNPHHRTASLSLTPSLRAAASETTTMTTIAADTKTTTAPSPPQIIEFTEPTTGVPIKLIGCMHYNPTSIRQVETMIRQLAEKKELGSVIIESCDIRWNTTMTQNAFLRNLLMSEMRAAHDLAMEYERPVILGDQRINITVSQMQNGFLETIQDIISGPRQWQYVVGNVSLARQDALPWSQDDPDNLNLSAFWNRELLLGAPISLMKYPLSYLVKSPLATLLVLSVLFTLDSTSGSAAAAASLGFVDGVDPVGTTMTAADWMVDVTFSLLEVLLFARVFLKELLAERNKVLAQNILGQCFLYGPSGQQRSPPLWSSFWLRRALFSRKQPSRRDAILDNTVYAPAAIIPPPTTTVDATSGSVGRDDYRNTQAMKTSQGGKKKTKAVVAVLGMAHCNGIMKLLKEQRVSV